MGGLSCSCPGGVQVRRTRTTKNRKARSKSAELVYLICSLPMTEAQPEVVAAWTAGTWGIENRLHVGQRHGHGRGPYQPRTHNSPEIMATLRNLAISLIHLFQGTRASIATTTRSLSRRPTRAIRLLTQPTP